MSTIHLIRHGQASIHMDDYDVLSERGVRQAQLTGAWIASAGPPLDAIYVGPLRRQRDTARHLVEAVRAAGRALPDPTVLDELAEFPAFHIVAVALARASAEDRALAARLAADPLAARAQDAFERAIAAWMRGEIAADGLESWPAFEARVRRALDRIREAEGRGREIAVVTSGGPISVAVKATMGVSDETVLRLQGVVSNASITELRYAGGALTLARFNSVHHLPRDLHTQV